MRKLPASSSQAIAGTLEKMRDRLIRLREGLADQGGLAEEIIEDEEIEEELLDEILAGEEPIEEEIEEEPVPAIDPKNWMLKSRSWIYISSGPGASGPIPKPGLCFQLLRSAFRNSKKWSQNVEKVVTR